MRHKLKRYLLLTIGVFAIILGLIGAVLPILPTTPFLIVALWCFANSSPKFHQALLNNPWFGDALQQWEQHRSINPKTKIKAMLLIIISFSSSIFILQGRLYLQLGLAILGISLLIFLSRFKQTTFSNTARIKVKK